jgi:hypothetical protein
MLEKEIDVYGDEEFASFTEEKRNQLVTEGYVPSGAEGAPASEEGSEEGSDGADEDVAGKAENEEAGAPPDDDVVQSLVEQAVEEGTENENQDMSDTITEEIENEENPDQKENP